MALNHVSDRDIVECLQNCPEIDAPLFDVNILDELCLSDELWANLEFPDGTTSIEGHLCGRNIDEQDNQICDVPGLVTPPYSPPTPSQFSSSSSSSSPPSTGAYSTTNTITAPLNVPPSLLAPTTSVSAPQQPSSVSAPQQPSSVSAPQQPSSVSAPQQPSSVSAPQQPSSVSAPQSSSSLIVNIPQDLAKLCSHITLPVCNGSLQVLKSGELVHLQVEGTTVQSHSTQPSTCTKKDLTLPHLPPPSNHHLHVKPEPPPVVGQKRQHPEAEAVVADMSKLSKKQQRMIKNRESASISRQKKRQYMDSLEGRLKEAALKNSTLLQENTSLRKQVGLLEKENEFLRLSFSQPSSPSKLSMIKKPALVMMVILCFSLSVTFFPRGPTHDSNTHRSPITALTHVKNRALLSLENKPSKDKIMSSSSDDSSTNINALVPVYSELSTELKRFIENRMRRWKGLVVAVEGEESPVREFSSSMKHMCSCPVGRNDTRELNRTNISLMNKEMTNCFRMSSPTHYNENHVTQNSLTILSSDYAKGTPNYLVNGPKKLYQDFKKYIPQDMENYYLLSFKDHVLLHPLQQNSTHYPFLSVFVPADPDYTSLLQMDCEVMTTKIIRHF